MPVYYSDLTEVADMSGKDVSVLKEWWQRDVDALIEAYAHQSYKGVSRNYTWIGEGNTLLVLPSVANTITSISENGIALTSSDYNFHAPSRLVERKNTNYQLYPYNVYSRTGVWYRDSEYLVVYVEPATAPGVWKAVANQCVNIVALFADKFTEDGIALTISNQGQAGGRGGNVSSGGATSFPASLIDELDRIIRAGIPRVGI